MQSKELLVEPFVNYEKEQEAEEAAAFQRKCSEPTAINRARRKSSTGDFLPTTYEALKKICNLALFPIIAMIFHPLY